MEYDEYVVDLNADCKCGCMDTGRFHKIYHFPNDYGASVVGSRNIPGEARSYRIMLLQFSSFEDYENIALPGFDSKVIDCDDWESTVKVLDKVISI